MSEPTATVDEPKVEVGNYETDPSGVAHSASSPNSWQAKNLVKRAVRSSSKSAETSTKTVFLDIVGAQQAMLEKNRNMEKTLTYRTDHKFLSTTLFTWHSTILPRTLSKLDVWIATIFHIILFTIDQYYREYYGKAYFSRVKVTFGSIGMCTWLLVFSLSFFTSQCYGRYLKFYSACTALGGKLMQVAQKLTVDFETLPDDRWNVVRYLTAEIMLVYANTYERPGVNKSLAKQLIWKRLTEPESEFLHREVKVGPNTVPCPPILNSEEVEILKNYNGNKIALLQTWALKAASAGYEKIGISRALVPVKEEIFTIGANGSFIGNTLALPVPFPYYHILILMAVVDYFLFAIAFVDMNSILSPVVMFLAVLMLSGLRELACALSDPFGDDEQDFPINAYITKLRASIAPLVIDTPWYPSAAKFTTEGIKQVAFKQNA